MLHNLFKQYSDFQFSSILSLFQDYFFITYIFIHSYLNIYKLKISFINFKIVDGELVKKANNFLEPFIEELVKKANNFYKALKIS